MSGHEDDNRGRLVAMHHRKRHDLWFLIGTGALLLMFISVSILLRVRLEKARQEISAQSLEVATLGEVARNLEEKNGFLWRDITRLTEIAGEAEERWYAERLTLEREVATCRQDGLKVWFANRVWQRSLNQCADDFDYARREAWAAQ